MSQVTDCSVAGRLFWGGPATLFALQQRFPSLVPSKESDLRHQRGRPATPEWKTCDAICLTAAISVAGPQQRIGPATPEWQTCDAVCFPAVLALPVPSLPHPAPVPLPVPCRSRSPSSLPPAPASRSHSPPPSSRIPASQLPPAAPCRSPPHLPRSRPAPPPGRASETLCNTLNILTLVFWWQSIYICDI